MLRYRMRRMGLVLGAGLFLAFGVGIAGIFVLVGMEVVRESSTLADRGRSTTGTVLDSRTVTTTDSDGGTTTTHEVLVEFGAAAEVRPGFGAADDVRHRFWTAGRHPVGSTVPVVYDPADPTLAITHSAGSHRTAGIIVIAIGSTFALVWAIGVVGWVVSAWW